MQKMINMTEWRYSREDAWTAMHAIAKTLEVYLDKYIVEQFGYDKKAFFAKDVELLSEEITAVMKHIKDIRDRL